MTTEFSSGGCRPQMSGLTRRQWIAVTRIVSIGRLIVTLLSGVIGHSCLALVGPASEPVGRAADAEGAPVRNVRVDHRRANAVVARQFLHGAVVLFQGAAQAAQNARFLGPMRGQVYVDFVPRATAAGALLLSPGIYAWDPGRFYPRSRSASRGPQRGLRDADRGEGRVCLANSQA